MKSDLITAVIFSRNNEKDISDCIRSVKDLTENIVLLDLESNDATISIARKSGIKVVSHPVVKVVEEVREYGINQAVSTWVLILDADERLTPELTEELHALEPDDNITHYKIPRKEIFARKKWLQHGGWWPNHQTRFFKKQALVAWPATIHAFPRFSGELGYLKSPFLHYSQNDWSEIVEKTIRFESTESQLLYEADKPVSTAIFFRKFMGELYRRLIRNEGYKDGTIGVIESLYQAFSKTITYLFLYEKKKKSRAL